MPQAQFHQGWLWINRVIHIFINDLLFLYLFHVSNKLIFNNSLRVCAGNICWFLKDEEIKKCMESNYEYLFVSLFNLYRATDLAFQGEFELDEVRGFSRKLLEKSFSIGADDGDHKNPFNKLVIIYVYLLLLFIFFDKSASFPFHKHLLTSFALQFSHQEKTVTSILCISIIVRILL